MISGLLILNSSLVGSRDLWWVDDPAAKHGYNIYRAFDYPTNWIKTNSSPVPGHFYRDESTVEVVTHTVVDADWVERGEQGRLLLRLPDVPYSSVVRGQPQVATSPDDVQVLLDGVVYRPAQVSGLDRLVWLRMDNTVPVGGAVSAFPVTSITGVQEIQVVYNKLTNFVDIYTTLTRTYYAIVGVDESGKELHAPGALGTPIIDSYQVDKMDYMQAGMVARNAWLFEQTGEPALLMFRRTQGTICGCKTTAVGQARGDCKSCYGVGIVGGYYGPYDFLFQDPDVGAVRTSEEGGIKVERTSRSFLGPTPIVQDADLIVRRNGERLIISRVTYKSPRGVILQQEFDVTLLNRGSLLYLIPVVPSRNIYNPKDEDPGMLGVNGGGAGPNPLPGEPIFQKRNTPETPYENEDKQTGRTVRFGKIQS